MKRRNARSFDSDGVVYPSSLKMTGSSSSRFSALSGTADPFREDDGFSLFGKLAPLFLRFPQVSHEAHKFFTGAIVTAIARLAMIRQSALHRECRYLHARCGPQRTLGAMRANGFNAEATLRCGGVFWHAGAGGQEASLLRLLLLSGVGFAGSWLTFLNTAKALCGSLPPLGHLRRDGARQVVIRTTGPGRRVVNGWLEPWNSLIRQGVG